MTLKKFTRKQVEAHNHKDDAMIIIDNMVYDVTPFLEDHPGGADVLLANAGKDASKCFHDVGHTEEARDLRRQYLAGEVEDAERWEVQQVTTPGGDYEDGSLSGLLQVWVPPLVLAAASIYLYMHLFS